MHAIALSYFLSLILDVWGEDNVTTSQVEDKILSRQKRYLIFPAGSSFQVILEIIVPLIGDKPIFRFGTTAAVAWELPSDPSIFLSKKKFGKVSPDQEPALDEHTTVHPENNYHEYAHEKSDWITNNNKTMYYTQPVYINKVNPIYYKEKPNYSYHNRFNYRPSYNSFKNHLTSDRRYSTLKLSSSYGYSSKRNQQWADAYKAHKVIQNSAKWYKKKEYSRMHPVYSEYHRRSRRDLFVKIEKLFNIGQLDGRSCVLKAICEISDASKGIGSFTEEILKVLFKVQLYKNEAATKDVYDEAVDNNVNCFDMYPQCKFSIFSLFGEMQKFN